MHMVVARHMPVWQLWPIGQTVPQAPQLLASVCVSTQLPAHEVWVPGHITIIWQTPAWQTWPAVPRSQSASVEHWQKARMPASLPAARPEKVAHVLAESGQSLPPVHAVTHDLSSG